MQEYTHGVKHNWTRVYDRPSLTRVLNAEFPGWKEANFEEDFNGQTMEVKPTAWAFRTTEDALQFLLKYGQTFGMELTTDLWFHVKPF